MDQPTVSYCDDQAEAELFLAGEASDPGEQKRHLNRAAIFAHCSEAARRDAQREGVIDVGAHCCSPRYGLDR